ncbi:MAG: efflux RND transporter permease subunit, partial [Candidatus Gracilibacteria bacterium]|nr:efflux RND transporter permease subunit [Candidatus Gracilibacteria bacterium]
MNSTIQKINNKLESGFFGFWVRRYKVSFLAIFLIIVTGLFALYTIPKESSPDIKFGIIGINTVYTGVNPNDIDSLITEKIEKEIKNIEGIKKMTSTSSVGLSSVVVELHNDANTRDVMTDIKDEVDTVDLPEDAQDSFVTELSSSNELMFEVLLFGDAEKFSQFDLITKSNLIKNQLEGKDGIDSIDLGGADLKGFGGGNSLAEYDIKVLIDKGKIENLGLKIGNISQTIRSYNKNTPIGNYTIGDLNYDFRFDGELKNIEDLKNIVLQGSNGSYVYLNDVAEISKEYNNDTVQKLGFENNTGFNYTSLVFNKKDGANIFKVSDTAKESLEDFLEGNIHMKDLEILYTKDLSEVIIDDYANLGKTAGQTLLLVFITILLFVGLRESIIASLLIPLAFLITFIVLDTVGLSLNFLTNFSLVLTLGIAIDTVIVIIEGASEKLKLGYNKKAAVLLAVKEYKAPLIAGTLTTLVAFLPLMFLPGVMGKFLAYIPITVFTTLLAALFLSLTLSSTLFIKLVNNGKNFHKDEKLEATFGPKQKEFLAYEREGKTETTEEKRTLRETILMRMGLQYYNMLKVVILSRKLRLLFIISPIIVLIFTFSVLAPKIGFILFPATDESVINIEVKTKAGSSEENLRQYLPIIDNAVSTYPELKVFYNTISGNKIDSYIELSNPIERQENNLRSVFEIEKIILEKLTVLEEYGLSVSVKTQTGGPPTGKPIGIKLVATNTKQINELKEVAEKFKEYLKTIEGVKNATTSSSESPGQFIFQFNKAKLAEAGLTPDDILGELYFYTNGVKAGSIKSKFEDNDIIVKIKEFDNNLSPDDLKNITVSTRIGDIRVGDYADYDFVKAVSSISRNDSKISISVESDILTGYLPTDIQPLFLDFAEDYSYPEGISFLAGGENEENSDLIISTFKSLFIAIFLIFSILVFQFNSFKQPAIVLYSVVLALLGVNIGLYITGNPYSMPFMIGFIALTGVVV